ncbi:hypothetical protein [Luteibacter sp. ME-Dv--P-043b]|uniref:hypothetical protein n=1 Tax=Luteibacter sp. ME-Dv--P-043b TaxID=3040291 RepID=UPI002556EE9E|nr:hypothetical protein [Luteibacter sp. ME-Dv--P-043b]
MKYLMMFALLMPLTVRADDGLVVTLAKPANPIDAERGVIEVTMRNDGAKPLYLAPWSTLRHSYFFNVFCIRDAQGKVSEHRINMGKPVADAASFQTLAPHSTQTYRVDLDRVYDLPDGAVDVTYTRQTVYDMPDSESEAALKWTEPSNTLHLWINRSLLRPAKDHADWQPQVVYNTNCNGEFAHPR